MGLKKEYYPILFLILLFFGSCNTTKRITVEFPQKGSKELPEYIQSLVLVNRTIDNSYTDLDSDSLQKIFYINDFNLDTTINDITAADTTLKALGELLYESGRYDFVIPENRFLAAPKNAFFSTPMPWVEVHELCNFYNTDALLSVDMFKTRIVTRFDDETLYDPQQGFLISAVEAKMAVIYEALLKVYDPVNEKIIGREVFKDTLYWEDIALSTRELFASFTPVKQALSEAGIAIALDYSEQISTTWHSEYRVIFIKGSEELKEAGLIIEKGEWKKAIKIWEEVAKNAGSKKLKSQALFNLAIAYEIHGDMDKAIDKALESYNTMYRQITYQYLKLLEQRKKELIKQNS